MKLLTSRIGRKLLGTVTHVVTQNPVAALTFDDGPHPEYTPRLLDILAKHGASATFFVVGESAQRQPKLIERMARSGHTIGNHTWNHPSMPLLTGSKRRAQVRQCGRAIAPHGVRLFRPPHGHQNLASRLDVLLLGYQVITWNISARDWLDYDRDQLLERVVNGLKPGSIVLFHDALYKFIEDRYRDRRPTLQAVDALLQRFKDQYRFVTVPELLSQGRPARRAWYRKPDRDWVFSLKNNK
jgi:peptidoglycan/xylan/chitin deacetylase (PgdA/CDA1 family)